VLGLINYFFMLRTLDGIGSPPDEKPVRWGALGAILGGSVLTLFVVAFALQHNDIARLCVWIAGLAILAVFAWLIFRSAASERSGLIAALILTAQIILFFIFYNQMQTSLTLFALRNVDWDQTVFGMHLFSWQPGQYQALNAIRIMLLSAPLAWTYTHLGKTNRDLPIAPGTRSDSRSSPSASSSSDSAVQRRSRARCPRGSWSGDTASIRSANCW